MRFAFSIKNEIGGFNHMLGYLFQRFIYMLILLLLLSIVSFTLIQLPPGDYLSTLIAGMRERGIILDRDSIEELEEDYGLNLPFHEQYIKWLGNLLQGDMGQSFQYNAPVSSLIGERLALTVTISLLTLLLTYAIAIPVGIYSATHQYSFFDYVFTVFGFIGLAIPNFLLALILMYLAFRYLGWSVGGLFSPEYLIAPWSWGKVLNLLQHLPIPIIVVGTAGTARLIRVMRASLLDELKKQYVVTARVKGLSERKLHIKYPVRMALNPIVSTLGYVLPDIISGATLTAVVLNLPTIGPLLLEALKAQDLFLAGSIVMLLGALGIIGTIISDMLLVVVDPRIRFEKQ
jgi:peptide/nickel transport system permease protein